MWSRGRRAPSSRRKLLRIVSTEYTYARVPIRSASSSRFTSSQWRTPRRYKKECTTPKNAGARRCCQSGASSARLRPVTRSLVHPMAVRFRDGGRDIDQTELGLVEELVQSGLEDGADGRVVQIG